MLEWYYRFMYKIKSDELKVIFIKIKISINFIFYIFIIHVKVYKCNNYLNCNNFIIFIVKFIIFHKILNKITFLKIMKTKMIMKNNKSFN